MLEPTTIALVALGGGVLAFAARRLIASAIDASFKTRMELGIGRVRHELNLEFERYKTELAKEFQAHLRDLDRSGKTKDRLLEANINLYEAFRTHFGGLMSNIVTFSHLREFYSERGIFDEEKAKLLAKASDALEIVNQHNLYAPPHVTVGIADAYASIVKCLIDGADDNQVDKVIKDVSTLSAGMRTDLEWPKKYEGPALG